MDILKRLQINIPFTETLEQMPTYAKFMKELFTKKRKFNDQKIVELEAGCSAIIQKSLPQKSRDPGSFTLRDRYPSLGTIKTSEKRGAFAVKSHQPTRMTLQLVDRSIKYPHGIVEDLLVKVDNFLFPIDFVVMDIEEDVEVPLILGRPFMKTAKVIIDVDK
ncbi:uncharacterized protein [Phaseolus vulgaris]|uniref:uncharacterized protein n=1 Tax=Phaseolus vulgaris TaxID=3885 RepID=UPI0035C9B4AC